MTIVWILLALWLVGIPLAWFAIVGVGELFDHARELRERRDAEQEAAEHSRPLGNANVIRFDPARRGRA